MNNGVIIEAQLNGKACELLKKILKREENRKKRFKKINEKFKQEFEQEFERIKHVEECDHWNENM